MLLIIPVVNGHDLTKVCLDHLESSVTGENFSVVIYDNGSDKPYKVHDFPSYSFPVVFIRDKENTGYYRPLEKVAKRFPSEQLIGLMHNDMLLYEKGWNERMEHSFAMDNQLGLVGLCGSNEIDGLGGRGGGTVCYFEERTVEIAGQTFTGQSQAAGRRTTDLVPSACLDSLFMMFRAEAVQDLVHTDEEWDEITPAHFYDRIWPLRLIENNWHVATLGVPCDHIGGMTTTGNTRYRDDCIKWLDAHNVPWRINDNGEGIIATERLDHRNIPCGNPETQVYLVAEDRYLKEYREEKRLIPCIVHGDYSVERTS